MAKPILNNIPAFDVNIGAELNFKYDQSIYGYNIKFYNITSNEVAKPIIGVWNTTTITLTPDDLSGLTNETNYSVSLAIYNTVDDYNNEIISSEESEKQFVRCITTPTISLDVSDVIDSSTAVIGINYSQEIVEETEKEEILSWQVFVYDYLKQEYTRSELFNTENDIYNIYGLDNESTYTLKLVVKTVNGMELTYEKDIQISYTSRQSSIIIKTEDLKNGIIKINTNIAANLYRIDDPSHVTFNDGVVDLLNNGVEYYDGLVLKEDMSLLLRFKNPIPMSDVLTMSVVINDIVYGKLSLTYMERYNLDEYDEIIDGNTKSYLRMTVQENNETAVFETDYVAKPEKDTWYNVIIRKNGALYSLNNTSN